MTEGGDFRYGTSENFRVGPKIGGSVGVALETKFSTIPY